MTHTRLNEVSKCTDLTFGAALFDDVPVEIGQVDDAAGAAAGANPLLGHLQDKIKYSDVINLRCT